MNLCEFKVRWRLLCLQLKKNMSNNLKILTLYLFFVKRLHNLWPNINKSQSDIVWKLFIQIAAFDAIKHALNNISVSFPLNITSKTNIKTILPHQWAFNSLSFFITKKQRHFNIGNLLMPQKFLLHNRKKLIIKNMIDDNFMFPQWPSSLIQFSKCLMTAFLFWKRKTFPSIFIFLLTFN